MTVTPPEGLRDDWHEYREDATQTYYERSSDGVVTSRPYTEAEVAEQAKKVQLDDLHAQAEEAIPYLDERIDLSLAYFAKPDPTAEETAAQIKVLSDLAAYSAGTLKRLIVVLADLIGRSV